MWGSGAKPPGVGGQWGSDGRRKQGGRGAGGGALGDLFCDFLTKIKHFRHI